MLLERLGVGSGGTVHLARRHDSNLGADRLLVVKRLHGDLAARNTFVRRFRHEALVAVSVDSDHVTKVVDVGRVGDTPYIAMEHVSGVRLIDLLEKLRKRRHNVRLEILSAVIAGGLKGLTALNDAVHPHTGEPLNVVHRDISPANLILSFEGRLLLIDLGLGTSNVQDWQTDAGTVLGSLGYMAPEQVVGDRVDHRADVYSMTAVFYELLALRPYIKRGERGEMLRQMERPNFVPPSEHRDDVPPELDQLVADGLSVSPDDRPVSADEMRQRLERVVPPAPEDEVAHFVAAVSGEAQANDTSHVRDLLLMPIDTLELDEPAEPTVVFARRESSLRTIDEIEAIDSESETYEIDGTVSAELRPNDPTPLPRRRPQLPTEEADRPTLIEDELRKKALEPVVRVEHKPRGLPVSVVVVMMVATIVITIAIDRLVLTALDPPVAVVSSADPKAVRDNVQRLENRATLLRTKHPEDAEQIDAILADLEVWKESKDYDRAAAALAQLEKALDKIGVD